MKLYDTKLRRKVEFKPIEKGKVGLYTCGTVYKDAHIGNFRTYVFEDLLRRSLKYLGYDVTQVMNITDVEDKTIRQSREAGIPLSEVTEPITVRFFEDLDALNIERAEVYPKATEHIEEMLDLIGQLINGGYAYEVDGSVYFSISKFAPYGKLSGMKLDGLNKGVRIDSDEYERDDFRDFALWKAWTEDDGDVSWDSPYGRGRPGWHIECSAMSMKYLGEQFDIHTGGVDNIFPHHENEIAQSIAATDRNFVNHWLHSAHLNWEGEKMSKSLGNQFTLRDILAQGHSPRAVRYALIATHYRQPVAFGDHVLTAAKASLERLDTVLEVINESESDGRVRSGIELQISETRSNFKDAIADDLGISEALAHLFNFVSFVNRQQRDQKFNRAEAKLVHDFWLELDQVLGFLTPITDDLPQDIYHLVKNRLAAKRDRNFELADQIREDLNNSGYQLKDDNKGSLVTWAKGIKKVILD